MCGGRCDLAYQNPANPAEPAIALIVVRQQSLANRPRHAQEMDVKKRFNGIRIIEAKYL